MKASRFRWPPLASSVAAEVTGRGTDPEQHRVRRWIAQGSWDWQPEQTIRLFLLRHDDRSRTETVLQTVPTAAQDSSDARLTWIGARWHGDAQLRPAQSLHYWLALPSGLRR